MAIGNSWQIDINCDVGEGVGNEVELFPLIGSCNIACGGHAGDEDSIVKMIRLAKSNQVKIGAHPSYPDTQNFGREVMAISSQELKDSLKKQLSLFLSCLEKENAQLHHIKPHGALYNQIAKDVQLARLVLEVLNELGPGQKIYAPFGSQVAKLAPEYNVHVIFEAFGDRNYNLDGSLVSRKNKNALITEPKAVLEHILPMVKEGRVKTLTGEFIAIKADTICVHGDTVSALEILMYLSQELPKHQVLIA